MQSRFADDALLLHNPAETVERIVRFLKTHTERIGAKTLIVGMSGGLDSSVTATLCARAVGGRRTLGLCLPEDETKNQRNLRDAEKVASKHEIEFRTVDISPLVRATRNLVKPNGRESKIPMGNAKARLRAMLLYYHANTAKALVVGTGDKSEIMLGYFTKYGDGACDIQPIADLYKTTVRHLGKHLGLPLEIYSKPSSPELWPGQAAEEELGLSYEKLDMILWGLERWIEPKQISRELAISVRTVESVKQRWLRAEQKRRPPLALKLGFRTSSQDLRLPYASQ
ncbi:NAD+ synthase [Candidatus Bathyarchaeota archaeon]|nr:NAD+ synthase [Candidatus Bathyarchaeota archaeon]